MSERQETPYLGPKGLWVVAILACVFNVVSVAGIQYQTYEFAIKILHREMSSLIDMPYIVSTVILSCPMFVALIARRSVPIVTSCASILFVIMLGRIYYLLPSRLTGVDGLALKYDWSDLCLILLGTLSGVAIAVWIIVRLAIVFNSILNCSDNHNHAVLRSRVDMPRGSQR